MKNALKKVLAFPLAAVMILGTLAGCAGNTSKDSSQSQSSSVSTAAVSTAPAETTTGASEEKITLKHRSIRSEDAEVWKTIQQKFNEKYPNITVEFVPEPEEAVYYQKLQADILSGEDLDIFDMHPRNEFPTYARSGYLADLSSSEFMGNYTDSAKALTTVDGKNYGYLLGSTPILIFYNKEIFKQLGVEPPKSFDDLVAIVDKSKQNGYGGIAYPGATVVGNWISNMILTTELGTKGMHDWWENIGTGKVTDVSTMTDAMNALKTVQKIKETKIFYENSESIKYDQALALFAQKKTPMMVMGTWTFATAAESFPGIDFGIFPFPTLKGADVAYAEGMQIDCVFQNSKNLDAAKKYLDFIASPEMAQIYQSSSKMASSIKGVKADFLGSDMLAQQAEKGINLLPLNDVPNYDIWGNIIVDMYTQNLYGKKNLEDYAKDASELLKKANLAKQ